MITLKLGDKGYKVALAQAWMNLRGFKTKVDGSFGVATKQSVLDVQRDLGLRQSGEFSFGLVSLLEAASPFGELRAVLDWDTIDPSQYHWPTNEDIVKEAQAVANEVLDTTPSGPEPKAEQVAEPVKPYSGSAAQGDLPHMKGDAQMMVKISRFTNPGVYVEFPGIPEELNDNNQANYTAIQTKGRSAPFQDYENSGPRTFTFNYELFADYCPGRDIRKVVNTLRSFTYPEKQGNIRPPKAMFLVGETSIVCIINTVAVTWKKPLKAGFYTRAAVAITLTEVVDQSQLYTVPAGKGSFI